MFGPKPPQVPYFPPLDVLIPEHPVSGEDCLNLNIWSSDLGSVAAPMYDGSRFARDGVVCVTINYRVGPDLTRA